MGMKIINGVTKNQKEKQAQKTDMQALQAAIAMMAQQLATAQAQLAAKTTTTTDGGAK